MSTTAANIITGALRLLGAISQGEPLAANEQADGLSALNDMIDSWSNENLTVFTRVSEEFALTGGTSAYTIGSAGTFNTTRPTRIENASIKITSTTPSYELPMHVINFDQWSKIIIKSTQSNIPVWLYYDDNYPLGTLNLWPVPASAASVVLYSIKPLTTFALATTVASFPPGYLRALRYNLAIELAPEYGKSPDPSIVQIASESKANLKIVNSKPLYLECDEGTLSRKRSFNWLRG